MSITIINIVIIIIGLIFLGVILISKKRGSTDNTNNNEQLNQKPTKHQQRRYIEFDFFPELLSIIEEEKWEDAAIFLSNVVELRSLAEAGVNGTHSNYGCLENPTIASFINRVKEFELKNQTLN